MIRSESNQYNYSYDYKKNVEDLENENFNLKYLLNNFYSEFRNFIESSNIQQDLMDTIIKQEKTISVLAGEITKINNNLPPFNKTDYQSPTIREQLKFVMDENIKLVNSLKEIEHQQYDNAAESSFLNDESAISSLDTLQMKAKISFFEKENYDLKMQLMNMKNQLQLQKNENVILLNEINEMKRNEKVRKNLSEALTNAEEQNSSLMKNVHKIEATFKTDIEMNKKDEIENAIDEINVMSGHDTSQMVMENMHLKNENELLLKEKERNQNLLNQLDEANSMIEAFKETISNLENGNCELMNAFNVLNIEEIGPKFESIIKENSTLHKQNIQYKTELDQANAIISDLRSKIEIISENNNAEDISIFSNIQGGEVRGNTVSASSPRIQNDDQPPKSQNTIYNQKKIKKYDNLLSENIELRKKKQSLQMAIQKLNVGNTSILFSNSQNSTKKQSDPIKVNVHTLYYDAKIENKQLISEVETLHEILNENLAFKVVQLSNELINVQNIQKK